MRKSGLRLFKIAVPGLFQKTKQCQKNDDHEERYNRDGQYFVVESDMAEFAVVRDFLFVVLKSPYLGDKYANENTADGHEKIGCEGVEPVVDAEEIQAVCVHPGKLHAAQKAKAEGGDNISDANDDGCQDRRVPAPHMLVVLEGSDRYLEEAEQRGEYSKEDGQEEADTDDPPARQFFKDVSHDVEHQAGPG